MTVWTVLTVCYVGSRARGDLICGSRTPNQVHLEISTVWETVITVQTAPSHRAFDFSGREAASLVFPFRRTNGAPDETARPKGGGPSMKERRP